MIFEKEKIVMNISKIRTINFNAICNGDYKELRNISVQNGMSPKKADDIEKKIQAAFPEDKYVLKFRIIGNPSDFYEVSVELTENDKILGNKSGNVLPKDIKYYDDKETKKEKAKVFEKVMIIVSAVKSMYNKQIKAEKAENPEQINNHNVEQVITEKVTNTDNNCIVSPTVEKIKKISIDAGFPKDKADLLSKGIEKTFSKPKYQGMKFNLTLEQQNLRKGKFQYIIYYNLIPKTQDLSNSKNQLHRTPQILSESNKQKDRRNLFQNLYRFIKKYY